MSLLDACEKITEKITEKYLINHSWNRVHKNDAENDAENTEDLHVYYMMSLSKFGGLYVFFYNLNNKEFSDVTCNFKTKMLTVNDLEFYITSKTSK